VPGSLQPVCVCVCVVSVCVYNTVRCVCVLYGSFHEFIKLVDNSKAHDRSNNCTGSD
jgi:hypothetical protein